MRIVRVPLRISFFGGGTDYPEYFSRYSTNILSTSINKYMYVSMNQSFSNKIRLNYSKIEEKIDPKDLSHSLAREILDAYKIKGVEISSISDVPANGTGLGSSSAYALGLLKCIDPTLSVKDLALTAYSFELRSGAYPGCQDHFASAYGGFRKYNFSSVGSSEKSLKNASFLKSHLLLLYTGLERTSSSILLNQKKNIDMNIPYLHSISKLSLHAEEALYKHDLRSFGELLSEGWRLKQKLNKDIGNDKLSEIHSLGIEAGAYGGKLLGAGSGGFFLFCAHPQFHSSIIKRTNLVPIPFEFDTEGTKLIYDDTRI